MTTLYYTGNALRTGIETYETTQTEFGNNTLVKVSPPELSNSLLFVFGEDVFDNKADALIKAEAMRSVRVAKLTKQLKHVNDLNFGYQLETGYKTIKTISAAKRLLIEKFPVASFPTSSQRCNAMVQAVKDWDVCYEIQLTDFQIKAVNHHIETLR